MNCLSSSLHPTLPQQRSRDKPSSDTDVSVAQKRRRKGSFSDQGAKVERVQRNSLCRPACIDGQLKQPLCTQEQRDIPKIRQEMPKEEEAKPPVWTSENYFSHLEAALKQEIEKMQRRPLTHEFFKEEVYFLRK